MRCSRSSMQILHRDTGPQWVARPVAKWLACWTQAQKGPGSNRSRDAVGLQAVTNCSHPLCLCSPSSKIGSSPLKGCGGNCGPGGKWWQPTAGFMTHVTCRLTAENRDQLQNPTLGNPVWATFTFLHWAAL